MKKMYTSISNKRCAKRYVFYDTTGNVRLFSRPEKVT